MNAPEQAQLAGKVAAYAVAHACATELVAALQNIIEALPGAESNPNLAQAKADLRAVVQLRRTEPLTAAPPSLPADTQRIVNQAYQQHLRLLLDDLSRPFGPSA